MNILIYGSNGWIGSQVINYADNNNIKYTKGNTRVDDYLELIKEIDDIKPTHILSLIGRTHGIINGKEFSTIDYLEQDGKLVENLRDNLFSPIQLAIICNKKNIHFTYLGTGCIFEYDNDHLYESENNGFIENDLPNFFGSSYSIVKGYTDRLLHLFPDVLNLRIRMPINNENNKRNFITKILNYEKICSIKNSMTVLPDIIPIIFDMIKNNTIGTFNMTNPGLISHNEILEMYKEIVDPDFEWKNFDIFEQNKILASKRSNNFLDTNKLQNLYPKIKNIKDAVRDCLKEYPKHNIIENRNILVTGGCGFIGSNFINYMMEKYNNINIINIDAMYYCANENNVKEWIRNDKRYVLVKGDIKCNDIINHILNQYNINYVIHFAAQSHVQNSFNDSILFTQDNVLGTHYLLDCCLKYGKIKKFIHVSTDEVYGESMVNIKTEHSILCPTNPYAGTKAGAELLAQSYCHSFKMPIIITRGNNVFGPNQYPEKVIPKFIKLLKENKKITIQGDGSSIRGFLHVSDTVKAFECILLNGKIGEIYNIGCDEHMEYSVMDIAKLLIKMIKNTDNFQEWIEYIEDRPYNDKRYYISNNKVKDIGWSIQKNFIDGLKELIDI